MQQKQLAKSDCFREGMMKIKLISNMKFGEIIFDLIKWILLVLFVLATIYPIINTLAVSLNEGADALKGGIFLLPRKFTLENYFLVFKNKNLVQASFITVSRTVIATVLQLFLTAMLSYVLCRKDFIFRKFVTILYVLTMYVNAGLIPNFLLMKYLGLTNNFWVYIIPGMISAFNMIVIRTFMNGLPDSLAESAKVDGAGEFNIFINIILPLCKPVLATVALFIAVYQWNSWFDTMLYNAFDNSLTTLQYELMKLLSAVTNQGASAEAMKNSGNMVTPATIRAAATIITAFPIVCLYPFLQKYFVAGLTIGGVKE